MATPVQPFSIELKSEAGLPVLEMHGYFGQEAAARAREILVDLLAKGQTRIIFDFSPCKLINSPGVVGIMKLTMEIVEDFQGDLAITGLDNLKFTVLDMAGVFPMAQRATSRAEAIRLLKK
ncbi:MAG: hypothetical protein OZSIB_1763 [Candidatus Ozemobacter sibiricus]|jgi:hypothetical protein|uniref:STAS domain-containing protein n=1 Tax=Candidatus Ozemobacter sibiricus TaxID=2268124 RepID=A0A367ZJ02_9BACT|nr:MAG: hypothetical protein OZSIB_1763 [Candidatus Ozemobacter sibiricus]